MGLNRFALDRLEIRRLLALNPGLPIRVDSDGADSHLNSSIAMAPDGSFVVAWDTGSVFPSQSASVYARRFSAAGVPLGDSIPVSLPNALTQYAPDVAINASGDFVITWERGAYDQDPDIYARCFDASGVATTGEIAVNTITDGVQTWSTVGISDAGNFTVAWTTQVFDESGSYVSDPVAYRRFAADGTPLGDEILVHPPEEEGPVQYRLDAGPQLAMAPDGSMVLAWGFLTVAAQRYDSNGAPSGEEISVSPLGPGSVYVGPWRSRQMAIDIQDNHSFAIAWAHDQSQVFLARYASDGQAIHGATPLITAGSYPDDIVESVALTFDSNGNVLVLSNSSESYIVRKFDAAANPIGAATFSTKGSNLDEYFGTPDIASVTSDGFTVVWSRAFAGPAVMARVYVPDSTPPKINSAKFDFETSRTITLEFSEPVLIAGVNSISVKDLATGFLHLLQPSSHPGEPVSSFTFTVPSYLGDGNYRLTFNEGMAEDGAGNPMGSELKFDFFIFDGDANHDRNIDVGDLKILAGNWMQSGKTFSQGDFNYDGKIDAADLGMLSLKWNTSLAPYIDPIPVTAPPPVPSSSAKRTKSVAASVLS